MTGQIAIIGLGQIGASVGMALKQGKSTLRRVGFDKDASVANAALTLDGVDELARRLADAVREADIVLLALPLREVPSVMKQIGGLLKDSAVVMETAPLKASTVKLMKELLPPERYYIGLVPVVAADRLSDPDNGLKGAHPNLFRRTVMVVDVPPGAPAEAEQLAVNFVKLLGAKPMLADLAESDGMMTVTHILPQLTAAALLGATVDQPGWGDGRKLAGRPFVGVTGGLAYYDDPESLKAAALANRTVMVHALDVLLASLQGLRDDVEAGDEQNLGDRLQDAFEARERWLDERSAAEWLSEGGESPDLPAVGEQLMQVMFGSRIADRMKNKKDDGKKNK